MAKFFEYLLPEEDKEWEEVDKIIKEKKDAGLTYVRNLGIDVLDIDKKNLNIKINKKIKSKKYNYYIKKYIAVYISKKLGYKKVIETLKKNFF